MNNTPFTCDFVGCGKYLHLPVTLPCGITICSEHLICKTKVDCLNCNNQHIAIDDFGFRINSKLDELIKNNCHLNGKHKEVKMLHDNLLARVNDFNESNLNNPENFFYDYFADLRFQIDLHRDEMIEDINRNSENLLKQLKELENQIRANPDKIEKMQRNDYINENFSDILRQPELNSEMLFNLHSAMSNNLGKLENHRKFNENLLKMNREIEFIRLDNRSLGYLQVLPLGKLPMIPKGLPKLVNRSGYHSLMNLRYQT